MANIVENRLTIKGERDQVRKLMDFVRSEERDFDFNKIIPMPPSLDIEASTETDKGAYLYLVGADPATPPMEGVEKVSPQQMAQMEAKLGKQDYDACRVEAMLSRYTPQQRQDLLELGKTAVENRMAYDAATWYDWCVEHWGVKWNAAESYAYGNHISFQTPWGTPEPVLHKLSELFPDVTIDGIFDIEGWGVYHTVYQAGEILLEEEVDPESAEEEEESGYYVDTEEVPDLTVKGSTFVLTGTFAHCGDDRDAIKDLIVAKGGRCTGAVSGKTSYLVIGSKGDWGEKKIDKVREYQAQGKPMKIISEENLFRFL